MCYPSIFRVEESDKQEAGRKQRIFSSENEGNAIL
jgi:hypothetical protein